MSEPSLFFKDVTKKYGDVMALDQFNLKVEKGQSLALLGSNGAGKSTFINLASGILSGANGTMEILGEFPGSKSLKKRMRILTQDLDFPSTLKVGEVLRLVSRHFQNKDFDQLVDQLELSSLHRRRVHELSGGEQKRVGIACSLIGHPDLVLLDEPTSNIDLRVRRQVYQTLKEHFLKSGGTLIFSSHQMQEVEELADQVAVMGRGRVIAQGTTQEMKSRYGLKKVCFESKQFDYKVESATSSQVQGEKVVLLGNNSDTMIREVISRDDTAKNFEITTASLDEIVLKLWSQGGASATGS